MVFCFVLLLVRQPVPFLSTHQLLHLSRCSLALIPACRQQLSLSRSSAIINIWGLMFIKMTLVIADSSPLLCQTLWLPRYPHIAFAILVHIFSASTTKLYSMPTMFLLLFFEYVTVDLAPDPYQLVKDCIKIPLHLDNDQLSAIHLLHVSLTHTNLYVSSLGTQLLGLPEAQSLKRLTQSKLKRVQHGQFGKKSQKENLLSLMKCTNKVCMVTLCKPQQTQLCCANIGYMF
jgi:hypothetical protein